MDSFGYYSDAQVAISFVLCAILHGLVIEAINRDRPSFSLHTNPHHLQQTHFTIQVCPVMDAANAVLEFKPGGPG